MKTLQLFVYSVLIITALQLLTSCSTLFVANPCIDPIVFTKPAYRDSVTASNYVGGKLNRSIYLNQFETLSDNYFGQLYCFQTITNKYFNTSFGAFGYFGKVGIEENQITNYMSYFGGGVSADAQLNIPYMNLNFKPLGIKGSLIYEDGPYSQVRADQLGGLAMYPDKFMCNISQTAGIDYQFNRSSLGLDISAGYSFMIPHLYMDFTYSVILNYTTPKFMIYLQRSSSLLVSNDDFIVGLNYRLR
jgi:hypothetical protein